MGFEFRPKQTKRDGPERIIQDKIKARLTLLGWYVLETFGNIYQQGLPDLFVTHTRYGQRWVEVKVEDHFSFTPAQVEVFPKLAANGSGVWVLFGDSDYEINKLFKPMNFYWYLHGIRERG